MNRLRYIIPFTWREPYKNMFSSLSAAGGWKCRADAHSESGSGVDYKEQDIYEHILKSFSNDIVDTHAIGSVWDYKTDSHKAIKKLTWFVKRPETTFYFDQEESAPEKYDVDIAEMGIYLFCNKVAFLWYEITLPDKLGLEELIEFQYYIKELNRNERSRNSSAIFERIERTDFPESEKKSFQDRLKRSIDREAGYVCRTTTKKNNVGEDIATVRGTLYRYFTLGDWIAAEIGRIAAPSDIHVDYFSGSTNIIRKPDDMTADIVPDKANLFAYVTLAGAEHYRGPAGDAIRADDMTSAKDTTESGGISRNQRLLSDKTKEESRRAELSECAFLLANGYKRTYLISPDERNEPLYLFRNVCCAASQAGCGYFAVPTAENRAFFEGNMKDKVMLDYFFLYVLALHQNYSLIMYARMISEKLSADPDDYTESSKMKKELESIISEINTFFVKNVNASVSMIAHQNDFYEYILERLRVQKNIESVKAGLDAIYMMQLRLAAKEEEQRKEKEEEAAKAREMRAQKAESNLNFSIAILSLIAIVSAFVDGHEMIGIWQNGKTGLPLAGAFQCLYIVLTMVFVMTFFYVVSRIIKLCRSKDSENY